MKIAIDISQICYEATGVATYTRRLVESLLAIDKTNEYILFGLAFRQRKIIEDFFKTCQNINRKVLPRFYSIPQGMANFFGNSLHYPDIKLLTGNIDLFHSSDWIQPNISVKRITTVHDLVIKKYPELSDPYIVSTQEKRLYWVRTECDTVIADSEATKKDLVDILKLDGKKIEVIYPGVEKSFIKASDSEIDLVKKKYDLTDDYILAVGTIEPRKNIKRVISAFDEFCHHSLISSYKKPIQLVLAGNMGWERGIKPLKNLKILGRIPTADLPSLYSGAELFVYPSLYEGFGLPVLEAMACETPVITSSRGSLKEVAGDAALLVDPEETSDITTSMVRLFIDSELRNSMIKKGKQQTENFKWENTGRKMLECYQKLID